MIIQLDQTGHVLGYADTLAEGVTLPGGLEIDFEPDGDFYKNYFQYLYQDGKLAKDCQTVSEGQKEQIRARAASRMLSCYQSRRAVVQDPQPGTDRLAGEMVPPVAGRSRNRSDPRPSRGPGSAITQPRKKELNSDDYPRFYP